MTKHEQFIRESADEVAAQGNDADFATATRHWMNFANRAKYSYHFNALGRPIIQYPQDMVAMQELIWLVQPDLIIETGIAHGGSIIWSAAMLELNAACGGNPNSKVVGIDIDIRSHNREAIEAHPMHKRIVMLEGSSVAPDIVQQVHELARDKERVLVSLDSNHTHEHVLAELEAYGPLTTVGSYCVVFDTIIETIDGQWPGRDWSKGNNPATAIQAWLPSHPEFEIDRSMTDRLLITVAPDGFLRRLR